MEQTEILQNRFLELTSFQYSLFCFYVCVSLFNRPIKPGSVTATISHFQGNTLRSHAG